MKTRASALPLLGMLVASCQAPQVVCTPSELIARDKAWAAAAFEKDLELLMGFYHDAAVQLAPGAEIADKTQLRELFSTLFADPDYSLTWTPDTANVAESCDFGYTRGDWTIISRNLEGTLIENTGKYLGVWARDEAGSWVVVEDIFNHGAQRSVD